MEPAAWNSQSVLLAPERCTEHDSGACGPTICPHFTAQFILLALAAENNNPGNLPSSTRTLPQGELLHRAILSQCPDGNIPGVLSGRDPSGNPIRKHEAHRHAHIMHLDLDDDRHLDHVLLWAPMGFDAVAQHAVRAVRREVAKKAKRPHRVAVAALGERRDILELRSAATPALTQRLNSLLGGPTGTTEWVSVTPFVPPRFLKSSGRNSLDGQIRAELAARGLPEPTTIEVLETNHGNDSDCELARRGRHFVRRRSKGGNPPPIDCSFMVRLCLSEPIPGPIALGYGCHFGMGAFEGASS